MKDPRSISLGKRPFKPLRTRKPKPYPFEEPLDPSYDALAKKMLELDGVDIHTPEGRKSARSLINALKRGRRLLELYDILVHKATD